MERDSKRRIRAESFGDPNLKVTGQIRSCPAVSWRDSGSIIKRGDRPGVREKQESQRD